MANSILEINYPSWKQEIIGMIAVILYFEEFFQAQNLAVSLEKLPYMP